MNSNDSKSRMKTLYGYVPPRPLVAPGQPTPEEPQAQVVPLFASQTIPPMARKRNWRRIAIFAFAPIVLAALAFLAIPSNPSPSPSPSPSPKKATAPKTVAAVPAPAPVQFPVVADEKLAAELLIAGKTAEALPVYQALAVAQPQRPVFAAIAKRLSRELKTRNVP